MIEDLGNQDQMTFFADYLFRAGATVVPLRPVGHQPNEVVLDNDDTEVIFSELGPIARRLFTLAMQAMCLIGLPASRSPKPRFARYRPNIQESGFYPVYSWTSYGPSRVNDQLYRITHTGGTTEVTVDHRRLATARFTWAATISRQEPTGMSTLAIARTTPVAAWSLPI